jgi:MFS family permease
MEARSLRRPEPEVSRRLRHAELALISLYWVALGCLWQGLHTLVLPVVVQQLVGAAHKGTALSVLEGAGTLVALAWQPLAGALSDRTRTRWGRRRPWLLAGSLADVVFLLGMVFAGGYGLLVIWYLLLQAASNTAQGPYQALLPDLVPESQRGLASGYYGAANILGVVIGVVGVGAVLSRLGVGAAFLSMALAVAIAALVTAALVPDRPGAPAPSPPSPRKLLAETFTVPLRSRPFRWLMASRLLITMGMVGMQTFALYYFSDVFFHGATLSSVQATYSMVGVVAFVTGLVTWPAGRLSDRLGRRPMILAAGLTSAVALLLLAFGGVRVLPGGLLQSIGWAVGLPPLAVQATLVGVPAGIGFGTFLSVGWALMADIVPRDRAGLFMGFANIATTGAGVLARPIGGVIVDTFNARQPILGVPGGYVVAFTVFSIWVAAGSLLVLKVRSHSELQPT